MQILYNQRSRLLTEKTGERATLSVYTALKYKKWVAY